MSQQASDLIPISPQQRIFSLDFLRGFAVLGILIINMRSMSMIEAAYLNPTAFGDFTGINKWLWMLGHVFAGEKFITLFSLLFGAGIVLFTERIKEKGLSQAKYHYKRIFWLLTIGLLHAYLIWHGDILVSYAICATIIYPARKLQPKTLLIVGLVIFSVASLLYVFFGFSMQFWPPESVQELMTSWKPSAEWIHKELDAFRGPFAEQMPWRIKASLTFQTFVFLIWTGWRVAGTMLMGMALYKWGVLSAQRSDKVYRNMIIYGALIGLPLIITGVYQNDMHGWSLEYAMFLGTQYNYWGSLALAMAYIGFITLVSKGINHNPANPLAAVGRMALSNYLGQSLLVTFLMYGHGFGLFGRISHWQQLLIVISVWAIQLIVSPIWLKYYHFGPVEWLWRSLTYGKRQPMRVNVS